MPSTDTPNANPSDFSNHAPEFAGTAAQQAETLDFAATVANDRGDDPLQADVGDLSASSASQVESESNFDRASSPAAKLAPVALRGKFEAEAMFAAITGKMPAIKDFPEDAAGDHADEGENNDEDSGVAAESSDAAEPVADDAISIDHFQRDVAPQPAMANTWRGRPTRAQVKTSANGIAGETPTPRNTQSPSTAASSAIGNAFALTATAELDPRGPTGAWWTLPTLFAGLSVLACALLIPAADENRRTAHELAEIRSEVKHFRDQSSTNADFLKRVGSDPVLAERLALRQLRMTRPDARVVQMPKTGDNFAMSPFAMTSVDAPPPVPAYKPVAGFLTRAFLNPQRQIFLAGLGVMLVAAGVILGGETRKYTPQPVG